MSEQAPASREVRPWELSSTHRPVWAYPECPGDHGPSARIFVREFNGDFRCEAPWCSTGTFTTPEDWQAELMAETVTESEAGNGTNNATDREKQG